MQSVGPNSKRPSGLSQQFVERLQAQVSKTKGQAAKSDSTHARLAELQRIHEQSKARHKADEERWQAKSDKAEKGMTDMQTQLSRLQGQTAEEEREKREEYYVQQRQRRALEVVARRSAVQARQLSRMIDDMALAQSLSALRERRLAVELQRRSEEVSFLRTTLTDVEGQLGEERRMSSEAWQHIDAVLDNRGWEDDAARGYNVEESPPFISAADDEERAVLDEGNELMQRLLCAALDDERARVRRQQDDLDGLQAQYLATLEENVRLGETERALARAREELETVEEAYEKGVLEVMRAHKGEEEVKRELSQSRAEYDGLASKLRQFEKIGKKIFQARAKEEAWLEEREELLRELERSSQYETAYQTLRAQAQVLVSQSTSYEAQMKELSSLNTILASHTNPSQKILYLDRIRRELDERRVQTYVLLGEKEELQAQCRDLKARLDVFCKVDARLEDRPRTAFKRVAREAPTAALSTVLCERSPNRSPQRVHSILPKGSDEGDLTVDDLVAGL